MTMKQKIFSTLVNKGMQKTASQFAAQLRTTEATVRARISDIRNDGYDIALVKHTNGRGMTKSFYQAS